MILTEKVSMKMNGKHIKKYRDIGYICKTGDIVKIKVEDLPLGSNLIVDVKCDVCDNLKSIQYCKD